MGKTGFCDLLEEHGIDPARFIAMQSNMINLWLKKAEESKESSSFRDYVEQDQTITETQKFINILERERVQRKIDEVTGVGLTSSEQRATT